MARTIHQHKGDTAQAHGMPFLKLALGSGLVLVLFAAMGAGAQNLLKGNVTKQIETKPNTDLVDRYGDAASDPAVADALRKVQGALTTEQIKEKNEAYDALQSGTFKPGADPMMAVMHGYVPPNMSPEQAQILSKVLPKMPRTPHPATPEDIARMAGEMDDQRTAVEPSEPYIPYPEAFAKAHGLPTSRKLQPIPQQTFPGQLVGMRGMPNVPGLPNLPGMPMMGVGYGTNFGLSQAEIRAQNQKIAEECIRARFGPVNIGTLQPGHAAIAEQQRKNATSQQHIAESEHQSVVGVCDPSGNEITSIQYDPYGQPTVLAGGSVMPAFMYKGMYYHDRSQMYLTPFRVYNPKLGRWLTRDPLGEAAGINLYAYCNNDPINNFDPLGLDIYQLNRKSDVLGAGHNAVLIGNDSTGYDFRSFRPANQFGDYYVPEGLVIGTSAVDKAHFNTIEDALAFANRNGYKRYIRNITCETADKRALKAADNFFPTYFLFGHQSDNFASTVMAAGGVNAPVLSTPNLTFQFQRNFGGWTNYGYGGTFGFTPSGR